MHTLFYFSIWLAFPIHLVYASVAQITTEFPYLATVIIEEHFECSKVELQNIKLQYENKVKENMKMGQVWPEAVSFTVPKTKKTNDSCEELLVDYLNRYMTIQVALRTLFPDAKLTLPLSKDTNKRPFERAFLDFKFLIAQVRFIFTATQSHDKKLLSSQVFLPTLFERVTNLCMQSVTIITSLTSYQESLEYTDDLKRLVELAQVGLILRHRAQIYSLVVLAYQKRIEASNALLVRLQFSQNAQEVSEKLLSKRITLRQIQTLSRPTLDDVFGHAKRQSARLSPTDLPLSCLDSSDLGESKIILSKSLEAQVYVRNAKSGSELVEQYIKTGHARLLGLSGSSELALYDFRVRLALKNTPLARKFDSAFRERSLRELPTFVNYYQSIENSTMIYSRFHNVALPPHFFSFYETHLMPRFHPGSKLLHLYQLYQISHNCHLYSILLREMLESGRILASHGGPLEAIQEKFSINIVLQNTSFVLSKFGIHGRIFTNQILSFAHAFVKAESIMAKNGPLVAVEGYEEVTERLSVEKFFECKCVLLKAQLESSKGQIDGPVASAHLLLKSISTYQILKSGVDDAESDRLLCMMSMVSNVLERVAIV